MKRVMSCIEEERAHEVEPESEYENEWRRCAVYSKVDIRRHTIYIAD